MKLYGLTRIAFLVIGSAASVAVASSPALAAPCSDLPNPVYLAGSTAFRPTAAQFALRAAAKNTTIVYFGQPSCLAPPAIIESTALTGTGLYYVADADPTKPPVATMCEIPPGTVPDIGVADVSYRSCASADLPAGVAEFLGPVQAMEFIVPRVAGVATINAISAEQAHNIWGCGAAGMITPFTVDTSIQQRDMNSGTQIMVSKYIGLAPSAFKGTTNSSGDNLVTQLLAQAHPDQAIGFLAADAYDTDLNRGRLNAVAFRGFGQKKAYYADSVANRFDKINVREGRYLIFGPVHFFAKLGPNGQPNANAKQVIDWIQGASPIDDANPSAYVDIESKAGMIPLCAMKVKRDDDGGLLQPYKPAVSCGCYYEHVRNGTDSQACGSGMATGNGGKCAGDTACKNGTTCQFGYCE